MHGTITPMDIPVMRKDKLTGQTRSSIFSAQDRTRSRYWVRVRDDMRGGGEEDVVDDEEEDDGEVEGVEADTSPLATAAMEDSDMSEMSVSRVLTSSSEMVNFPWPRRLNESSNSLSSNVFT